MVQPAQVKRGLRAPSRAIRYDKSIAGAVATPTPPAPVLVPVSFQQTDVVADHPGGTACSGLVAGAQFADILVSETGVVGSVERTFFVTTAAIRAHIYMTAALNQPHLTEWAAGTWTVRVRIAGELSGVAQIRTCHVCRVDQFGVSLSTVASTTDLFIFCTAGVKSWTLAGAATSGSVTDRVQIVIGMRSTAGIVSVRVLPDQKVDTPIVRAT